MYSTLTSIKNKINLTTLIQLLNDEGRLDEEIDLNDSTDLIVVRFNECVKEAAAEIDPYLRGRYTLPFTTVPDIIANLSDDFTIYNIYKRRNRESMPDSILSIHKNGVKTLELIGLGKLDIGVTAEPQTISNEIKTNKTAADKIFNPSMWNKF